MGSGSSISIHSMSRSKKGTEEDKPMTTALINYVAERDALTLSVIAVHIYLIYY